MTVGMCAKCGKLISISNLPGGNPIALADPDHWAVAYGVCERCGGSFCDKCIESNAGKCPECGRKVKIRRP